jgi:uncharacterized protein YndB with AHSA1/START domain
MNTQPLTMERVYDAPVSKVWEAFTNLDQLRQWFFNLSGFKPEVGFEFEFTGGETDGPKYVHKCRVTEAIPNKKIAYSWSYEGYAGDSEISFELFEQGNQTLLKLTHKGLESFAANGAPFKTSDFTKGWTYFVDTALKNHLAN